MMTWICKLIQQGRTAWCCFCRRETWQEWTGAHYYCTECGRNQP